MTDTLEIRTEEEIETVSAGKEMIARKTKMMMEMKDARGRENEYPHMTSMRTSPG